MKNLSRIVIILLFFIALYAALYMGADVISHMSYSHFQIQSVKNTSTQVMVLIIAFALLMISIIQFAGDMAIKKHISNLIFLLPAILAGVLLTCLAL